METEEPTSQENPYLDSTYTREKLTDLLHLAEHRLILAQQETPTSPKIIAYQTTIFWLSLALALKRK